MNTKQKESYSKLVTDRLIPGDTSGLIQTISSNEIAYGIISKITNEITSDMVKETISDISNETNLLAKKITSSLVSLVFFAIRAHIFALREFPQLLFSFFFLADVKSRMWATTLSPI